jgi:NADPH2:quinone reductase
MPTQTKGIIIERTGDASVLQYKDIALPKLEKNQVLLENKAIGLNYIDTYHRSGLYPLELPTSLGLEGSGVVMEVGDAVANLQNGDRVVYAAEPLGAYRQHHIMPSDRLVKIPDAISHEVAAACFLKGMTASYLVNQTYNVQPGDIVLVWAAAGGVGTILIQWAKHKGAEVIGIVGSQEKKNHIVNQYGCDHVILYREEKVEQRVFEITQGKKANVVYDSVGKASFESSLKSLRPLGMFASYGNASGPVEPFSPLLLTQYGSLFFTRPSLKHYAADFDTLNKMAKELFDLIAKNIIQIEVNQRYDLADAAQAHHDLEARKTHGSTILVPKS